MDTLRQANPIRIASQNKLLVKACEAHDRDASKRTQLGPSLTVREVNCGPSRDEEALPIDPDKIIEMGDPLQALVIEEAVAKCEHDLQRMKCGELIAEIGPTSEAAKNLRTCSVGDVCKQAREIYRMEGDPNSGAACWQGIKAGATLGFGSLFDLMSDQKKCYEDKELKDRLLGHGPWFKSMREENRKMIIERYTCAQIVDFRSNRINSYIEANHFTPDGLRTALDEDGTLSQPEIDALITSRSGFRLGEVARLGCYNNETQVKFACTLLPGIAASVAFAQAPTLAAKLADLVKMTGQSKLAEKIAAAVTKKNSAEKVAAVTTREQIQARAQAVFKDIDTLPVTAESKTGLRRALTDELSPEDSSRFLDKLDRMPEPERRKALMDIEAQSKSCAL